MSKLVTFIIRLYQGLFSPFTRPSCRYYPSCSEYAKQYIQKKGVLFSFLPIIKRIFSCNPFSKKSFVDPVP